MKRTIVWLSMLMLALACLSCVKDPTPPVHHHGDPDPVVSDPGKPSISVLGEEGYLYDGMVVDVGREYSFGFLLVSSSESQEELSRIVVTVGDEIYDDVEISGVEYTYQNTIVFVYSREIIGNAEIKGTVYDVAGESSSVTLKVDINQSVGSIQTLPYIQSFTSEFGTYMTYDVEGAQSWEIEFQTAKIAGYEGGTYYANEDWLISSPVNLSGVSDAKMTLSYIGRYFDNINDDLTIWASAYYEFGNPPNSVSWSKVDANLVEGSNWTDFVTTEIALTQFVGQTVTIAVKYVSHAGKSLGGTIEIQSIAIEEGSASGGGGNTGQGHGTADDPYNVAAGIENQGQDITAWVQGYIVGAVKNGLVTVASNDDVNWSAPFDHQANVVIADDPDCKEISQCIIVNLPNGKPLREQVNLVDHPENLGKSLAVYGTLRTYYAQPGLRDSEGTEAFFVLENGDTPPSSFVGFSETFANGQGDFVIQDVIRPDALSYIWSHSSNYAFMKASAYSSQYYASESWLVSPAIDLTGASMPSLSFEQAVNYYSPPTDFLSVMISTDYTGDVTTANWTVLNLDQWPEGANWTLIPSTADLTPFVGQTINIAFKYTSSDSANPTWEVKNFVVEE